MRRRGTVSIYWDITGLKQREQDLTEKSKALPALVTLKIPRRYPNTVGVGDGSASI